MLIHTVITAMAIRTVVDMDILMIMDIVLMDTGIYMVIMVIMDMLIPTVMVAIITDMPIPTVMAGITMDMPIHTVMAATHTDILVLKVNKMYIHTAMGEAHIVMQNKTPQSPKLQTTLE
jgi:hypothetical protein